MRDRLLGGQVSELGSERGSRTRDGYRKQRNQLRMPNRSFLSTRHDRILNIRSPQALRNKGEATIKSRGIIACKEDRRS